MIKLSLDYALERLASYDLPRPNPAHHRLLLIKFDWHRATPTPLHTVCDCLCPKTAELSNCDRDNLAHNTTNNYYLAL